ncbi:MAG: OmpH family outer membrane protein [Desulfuromonadaceae bacterium]|nr:OmpH family outer membrane protein [Desulfuromonadaceae bacterium]
MKRLWIGLVVVLMLVATPVFAADMKIAFVDLQKALMESDAGQAAKVSMGQRVKEFQTTAQQRQETLKKLNQELEKKRLMLSAEAKAEKERDYQQQTKDFQRFIKDAQEELQQEEARLGRNILEGLSKVIKALGDKEGYTLVLERSNGALLYADDSIDLTDKVIAAYNKAYKATNGK